MSEDFVDVTWRGLEVARKARLRGHPGGGGHLEHGTPMPIGTALVVTTAAGQTLGATVTSVREQIGGRTEPPGMDLAITASGEAAAWWKAKVEEAVAAAAAAAEEDATVVEQVPRSRTRTAPPAVEVAPTPVAPTPVVAAPVVAAPIVPAPPVLPPSVVEEGRPTEVMAAVSAPEETDAPPTIEMPMLVAPPSGEHPAVDAVPEELADDGRRTTVMAAIDIEAIVAASADGTPAADDTGDAPAAGGDKKKAARGKRRRTR